MAHKSIETRNPLTQSPGRRTEESSFGVYGRLDNRRVVVVVVVVVAGG